jgi:tRNA(Leu) C34 or U34 (ribose-2'-O)-methylase TrmL
MAIKKFIITENHIKLIKNLKFSLTDDKKHLISLQKHENDVAEEHGKINSSFGGENNYEDISIIINGKPSNETFDLIKAEELYSFTPEQKAEMDKLMEELPTALEIVLATQSFSIGEYKMKLHIGEWIKIS